MGPKLGAEWGNELVSQLGSVSITKVAPNCACQRVPMPLPRYVHSPRPMMHIAYVPHILAKCINFHPIFVLVWLLVPPTLTIILSIYASFLAHSGRPCRYFV